MVGYRVDDGELSDTATVRVTVQPCSAAQPQAPNLFLQTGYRQPIFIDLTTVAANGEIVSVGAPLSAASGVYTPPAGENGNVTFNYVVRNSCRLQAVGEVTIDVNQDPVGAAYSASIGRTQTVTIPVTALASDSEPLTIGALEGAPSWIAVIDDGQSVLVDPRGASGAAHMVAVIVDPGGLQARVPMSIQLANQSPVANFDQFRSNGGTLTIDVLANDFDPDGDQIALQSVPATIRFPNGVDVAVVRQPGDLLRIDPGQAVGTTSFGYTIVDSLGMVSQTANVTITINSPPTAPDIDVLMTAGSTTDVVVNASDPDGEDITLALIDDPSPLTITINGLTLTIRAPLEAASTTHEVDYQVTDESGATAIGTLGITVAEPTTTTSTTTTSTTTTSTTTTTTTTNPVLG